jgi:2-polyprenyl-3-methyl-5-hydroxy-6-metoxy-1,4-benzoquinol methylase
MTSDSNTLPPGVDIGLIDMTLSGWLQKDTGELLQGFPILATDKVLDIGCGSGGYTLFAGRQGAEIYVADLEADNVNTAVERLKQTGARAVHPLVTDANPIPLSDAQMDKVIAMEVLEHVEQPSAFLAELVRVGKPGALYLIAVPDAITENLQKGIAPDSYFQKPNHINIFERNELEKLVTDAGLHIERRVQYSFYRSLWMLFFWSSAQKDFCPPWDPLIESWDRTWSLLLGTPQGRKVKDALDKVLPKSQVIIARKPQ